MKKVLKIFLGGTVWEILKRVTAGNFPTRELGLPTRELGQLPGNSVGTRNPLEFGKYPGTILRARKKSKEICPLNICKLYGHSTVTF